MKAAKRFDPDRGVRLVSYAIHWIKAEMHEFIIRKDSEIVVHCSVGHRSGVAVSILKRYGFRRVYNMLGGITAWEKLDLPLVKSEKAKKEG